MNLIDAWIKDKNGKFKRKSTGFVVDFSRYENLHMALNRGVENCGDLLANDYEIVKEQKKVVVEGVEISKIDHGAYTAYFVKMMAYCEPGEVSALHKLPANKIMKATFEFEE